MEAARPYRVRFPTLLQYGGCHRGEKLVYNLQIGRDHSGTLPESAAAVSAVRACCYSPSLEERRHGLWKLSQAHTPLTL